MRPRQSFVAVVALGLVAAVVFVIASRDEGSPNPSAIAWKPCPKYSDAVLESIGVSDGAKADQLVARLECGTLDVPLDYDDPGGRSITVALTRLPATDRDGRLGSLALNPGGPGGSGYLMPVRVAALESPAAKLNERYDLIGFDPRGVNYSSKVDCPPGQADPWSEGVLTEQQAREEYERQVQANRECVQIDPAFIGALTTGNIARDLDRIRDALGERKLSYFGVSWGSLLGPVYRSLFPARVDRMWVDSVANPDPRMDQFEDVRAEADARNFSRMAEWIARFDAVYGLGTTGTEVEATIARMRADLAARPRKFADVEQPVDGTMIAMLSVASSPEWPTNARVLADLDDAKGERAPDSLKALLGPMEPPTPMPGPGGSPPAVGAEVPERDNQTAAQAIFCNGDGGARDFETGWAAYQDRLQRYPVTGVLSMHMNQCAGWPLPVQGVQLSRADGSLVLSGHRHEGASPYEWAAAMQDAVGGEVFTVEDDAHGSVLKDPGCAAYAVTYFDTGRLGAAGCPGVPVPDSPDS